MGEVIQFPEESGYSRRGRPADVSAEPATVIILPVVRVERAVVDGPKNGREPSTKNAGRRRRRRAAR
jgi:hypothetical protein